MYAVATMCRVLEVSAVGTAAVERIDVVRSGAVVEEVPCGGELACSWQRRLGALRAGEYLYVRLIQEDGGMAWSSPFFVD